MKGSLRLASKSFSAGTNRTSGPESGLSFLMSGRGCVLALFMLSVQFFGGFTGALVGPGLCSCCLLSRSPPPSTRRQLPAC